MNKKINKKILIVLSVIIISFIGFPVVSKNNSNCINLYVDYSVLDNKTKLTKCLEASANTNALDLLKGANLTIEGTKKYGDAVVCRVNGLPDISIESCEDMPSGKAYWAIIIKEKQILPFPTKEWGWGQLAINQQYLNPGDSIGLVWANNGEVVFP
jgi:hypothetical protein